VNQFADYFQQSIYAVGVEGRQQHYKSYRVFRIERSMIMKTEFTGKSRRTAGDGQNNTRKVTAITACRLFLPILLLTSQPLMASTQPKLLPDLTVKEFQFPPTSQQSLRVHVANNGESPAGPCKLRLTVRKIAGNAVARTTEIRLPAITSERSKWLVVDASKILPNQVALKETVFRLDIDSANAINETNEENNVIWHGLSAEPISAAAETENITDTPREQKLSCRDVSRRWQVCGSVSRTKFVAGIGIRFNRIDPNGRIVASRSYDDCGKLAADRTIPADIRAKAAGPCKESLQLASRQAAVR
jgi:hypothetical protein